MQIPVENSACQAKNTVPDFIRKLQAMINSFPNIISFSPDGTEVHIHDHHKFVAQMLPSFFRHRKWRSFIRQMNMYNFRKLNRGVNTYIFVNPVFWRGNQSNFHKIKRKINTSEEEQEADNCIQQQLKALLMQECQSMGIPNTGDTHPHPQLLKTLSTLNSSLPVLPHTILPLYPTPSTSSPGPSPAPVSCYSNSVTSLISSIMSTRSRTESLCQSLRVSLEVIGKERKNSDCKNVLNNIKDSIQMIEEVSAKFREKMENYVDEHIGGIVQGQSGIGEENWGSVLRNSGKSLGQESKQQQQQQHKSLTKQVHVLPQIKSFSSSSSINLIIPQPILGLAPSDPSATITNKPTQNNEINGVIGVSRVSGVSAGNSGSGQSLQISRKASFQRMEEEGVNVGAGTGYGDWHAQNMGMLNLGRGDGLGRSALPGQSFKSTTNIFGMKPQSSFTYLINFDKQ